MIGNLDDAARALRDHEYGDTRDLFGSGCSRDVYKYGDVLYKVDTHAGTNELEWENHAHILSMNPPKSIRLPEMSRYVVSGEIVLAVELISGVMVGECIDVELGLECGTPAECLSAKAVDLIGAYIFDISYGNIIVSDGCYYLIDVAC